MNFRVYIFCLCITLICGKELLEGQYRRLPNAVGVVGRPFEYNLPPWDGSQQQYKALEKGKTVLPKWLSFDEASNKLLGVPLWRDKGTVQVEIQTRHGDWKAELSITVQDLHTVLENKFILSNETKIPSFAEPKCTNGIPVAVATVQFDLHIDKLYGEDRINLMRKLSDFADVGTMELHMAVGKGHSTAFGLKDIMPVTAGPGNVADSKQPGVVISWKIGCGIDLSGMHVASLLKSSSEHGSFKQALKAPVSGWHIATGQPKIKQKRGRRQAPNLMPTPTWTNMMPTPTSMTAPPTISVTRTTITSTPTITVDTEAPKLLNPIPTISVFLGIVTRYKIPEDTFVDTWEGVFTRDLRLDMRHFNGSLESKLPPSSWIFFDSSTQEIYGLPFGNDFTGSHHFIIRAADKAGNIASQNITVKVSNRNLMYNHQFTIVLNYNYEEFMNNVNIRLLLINKLANYYGYDNSKLHVSSYTYMHGYLFFTFQFESLTLDCNSRELKNLVDGFGKSKLNPEFQKHLLPQFDIKYGYHGGIGPCKPTSQLNSKPVVHQALGQLNVYLGQGMRYKIPWDTFFDKEDYYTPSLTLELRTKDDKPLPSSSWINFDASQQEIYGQPIDVSSLGSQEFRLFAIDSDGLQAFTNVKLSVVDDTNRYNHDFGIALNADHHTYENLIENAENRVLLVEAIANYYNLNLGHVRIFKFQHGPSFHFRFDSIPYDDCKNTLLQRIIGGFWKSNEINPEFVNALNDNNFIVDTGYYFVIGPCEDLSPPKGGPPNFVGDRIREEMYLGQALFFQIPHKAFFDEQDFYTPNLKLSLKTTENKGLPSPFWIYLDTEKQVIYCLPKSISTVKRNRFELIATDSHKQDGDGSVIITVKNDPGSYDYKFSIRIKDYSAIKDDVVIMFQLLQKIARYYGWNYQNVRVFRQESEGFFTFGFDTIPSNDCDGEIFQKVKDGFWAGTKLNSNFQKALRPEFHVITGFYTCLNSCSCNTPPVVLNPIKSQSVFEGQALVFSIPGETFYDKEDGYNLALSLKTETDEEPSASWILLDKQQIKLLPIDKNKIGTHKFELIATDKEGLEGRDEIEVNVLDDRRLYNHMFSIKIEDGSAGFDVNGRVNFVRLLANYFGVNLKNVSVRSYGLWPAVHTTFQFVQTNQKCDNPELRRWRAKFMKNGQLNTEFSDALRPNFQVVSGSFEFKDICQPSPGPDTAPELYNHIDRLNVYQGQGLRFFIPSDTFFDKEDFFTPNLTLEMQTINGNALLQTSWILLNSSRQEIYGLPSHVDSIGLHEFLMVAADAGDYDRERISNLIDSKINSNKIMMFSFSTCPFCLRAKQILEEDYGEQIEVYECDLESDGYAVRAELGRRTGRTSMPSTWLGPETLLGGCNDGGLGGVATLDKDGRLAPLLTERRGAMGAFAPLEWLTSLGQPDQQQTVERKKALMAACDEAPKNGVGANELVQAKVESAAVALEASCPAQPSRSKLSGVWDLQYCTAEGSSNGKIGPFVGDVTQTFVDDVRFVNAVEFGPLRVALQAEREIMDDQQIRVKFKETVFSIFGLELFRKPTKGSGIWTQRFVDAGLRVMNTPSLFVLRKRRSA